MARGPREGQKTEDKQCGQGSQGKVRACKQEEVESDRVRERGEGAGQRGTRIRVGWGGLEFGEETLVQRG